MPQLARDPKVIKLARDLGLPMRGDALAHIRAYAIATVERIITESPLPIGSLDMLRRMVADKYRVRLEFLREDADVERIAGQHPDFHGGLLPRLTQEFLLASTEGITLERDEWDPRVFRYLAVIDARGDRGARAYFTAWHEITHLILHPAQLPFPGFRRSPLRADFGLNSSKDPLESVVDHVAGRLAFLPKLFAPVLTTALEREGGFTFRSIDAARTAADPLPSLFATAMGSLDFALVPTLLVEVGLGYKKSEARTLRSPQQTLAFAPVDAEAKLRLLKAIRNDRAANSALGIRQNMRVPGDSVLAQAFASDVDAEYDAMEEQGWWETSASGALESLPLRVQAIRRGRYVYGLISMLSARALKSNSRGISG